MTGLPASSCQRGMGRRQASESGMVALSTAFGRLATVGTDADPSPDRFSTYLGSGPNKQVLSIRIWPPDRHILLSPAPITKERLQSNPRVRALRHTQVRVKGSSLKHAEALPCIRYTV